MTLTIALLPGDGIGPEVTEATVTVLEAAAGGEVDFKFHELAFGGHAIDACGDPLPQETLEACKASHGVLLGAVGGPKWDGASVRPEQGLLGLRAALGLFANLRPVKVFPGLEHLSPVRDPSGMDILIVRELTGGIYFGEKNEGDDVASDLCRYSKEEVTRILDVAFDAAKGRSGRVTSVDKANVLATSRLWRREAEAVSSRYPSVALDHVLVDAMAMHLVTHPNRFDVVVTENMFGDILSDESAAISGSIGLAPSASLGAPNTPGLFEPIHGSAPDIAGTGKANPVGAILSAAMLLRFGGNQPGIAEKIEGAVERALHDGARTADLGGTLTGKEMTAAILGQL